jgi:hypothetical protein
MLQAVKFACLAVTVAAGPPKCCTTCNATAGEEKYFSVAEPLLSKKQNCGVCCMNPKDYNEYQ